MARPVSAVGGKDLQDMQGVSGRLGLALAQKMATPDEPRPKKSAPEGATETAAPVMPRAAAAVFEAIKQFSPTDYYSWITKYLRFRFGPKHPFLTYEGKQPSDGVYSLDSGEDEIRIGVAGDWGTGTDEAHAVGQLIKAFAPHHTIHLGDVYFVGDRAEVGENFLGVAEKGSKYTACCWPTGSKTSFALNGNHEMLARGIGYFEDILPRMGEMTGGIPQTQKASFFALMNADWCILGLDTGYRSVGHPILENIIKPDASLPPEIETWLQQIAPRLEKRAVVLMTHHQVLSAYDACFTKQADQISAAIKRPVIWFWGHEHRLVIYEEFKDDKRMWPPIMGRCIGHGGMPVDLPGVVKPALLGKAEFVDDRPYRGDECLQIGINGMALMSVRGAEMTVTYVDVHGQSLFEEVFVAGGGSPTRRTHTNHWLSAPA
jgi:Calcineurin-like phosphoesterase